MRHTLTALALAGLMTLISVTAWAHCGTCGTGDDAAAAACPTMGACTGQSASGESGKPACPAMGTCTGMAASCETSANCPPCPACPACPAMAAPQAEETAAPAPACTGQAGCPCPHCAS